MGTETSTLSNNDAQAIRETLERLTAMLGGGAGVAVAEPPKKDYGVEEAARLLGRASYTVREWCRQGQCNAFKAKGWGRGPNDKWRIPAAEVDRLRAEGLLPIDVGRNSGRRRPGA